MAEKEKGKKEIDIDLPKEQLENAVQKEVDKRVSNLLKTMDERDGKLKSWSKQRDEQMGAHMNDMKRSVDAQNARVAQYGHKIDGLTARFVAKASPESPPPPKDGPPEAPPEEMPPEEAPKEGAPAGDPKEEPPEEAPPEEPEGEEPQETELTTVIGQCTAGGDKTHYFEKGEESVKFCPEDGMRVKHYDSPRTLKTKPKP